MNCPNCRHENPNQAKFCMECGTSLFLKPTPFPTVQSERKQVTVLFSDLSGYTAMTERLDPEDVKEIMSRIFGDIAQVIAKYDGFIERFIGDSVMAVFGVPRAHEDDPVRAIRVATEIHALVDSLSPKLEDKVGQPLTMHTGINTGLVVTGEVDLEKGTHGLTGDAINLASRLEGLASAGEILVGRETYKQAVGHFFFDPLEPARVKGKAEKVSVYKVGSSKSRPTTLHRIQGVRAELIGRDAEMVLLANAVEKLKDGQGSIISIVGEAGTGKSRLIQELKPAVNQAEAQWHEGHSYAYTQNIPYYPLIYLLTQAFGIREEDKPEQIKRKLYAEIKSLLGKDSRAAFYIGGLFSVGHQEYHGGNPELWRVKLHESVVEIIQCLSRRSPMVICLEDLHWADSSFVELLKRLFTIGEPILFLCAYRPSFSLYPEGPEGSLPWPLEEIHLEGLSKDDTRDMLESLLSERQLPEDLVSFMTDKVEGNPFYLEEMVNSLIESNALLRGSNGWAFNNAVNEADLPTTITGLLTARLDRLEPETKQVLQEASVIGRTFSFEILKRITAAGSRLEGCLIDLEQSGLIRIYSIGPDLEYIFKHALIQDVAYDSILNLHKRTIHEKVGATIEDLCIDKLYDFYEILGHHYSNSSLSSKALYYLKMSGIKSTQKYSSYEALCYFRDAIAAISQLEETADTLKNKIDIVHLTTFPLLHLGYPEEFLPLLNEGISSAEQLGDSKSLASFYGAMGSYYAHVGMPLEGMNYAEMAYSIARPISDVNLIAPLFFDLCAPYIGAGEFAKTAEVATHAIKIIETHSREFDYFGKPMNVYSALCARCGGSMAYLGDFDQGEKILGNGLVNAQNESDDRALALVELYLGHLHLFSGRWPEAKQHYKACCKYSEKLDWTMLLSLSYSGIGNALSFLGEHGESIEYIETGLEIQTEADIEWWLSLHYWFLAIAMYHQGNYAEGIDFCRQALSLSKKNSERMVEGLSLIWLGRLTNKAADPELNMVEQHLLDGIRVLEEHSLMPFYAMGYFFAGELYVQRNDGGKSQEYLDKASVLFSKMNMNYWLDLVQKST